MEKKQLFRPYLESSEILTLMQCLELAGKHNTVLYQKLLGFKFKISHSLVQPQYTRETLSLSEKLGLSESVLTPEQKREQFQIYASQNVEILSPSERLEYLMQKSMEEEITEEEKEEGRKLEIQLNDGFISGIFD